MKKTFIEIRNRISDLKPIRTYTYKGDVSIIITSMSQIMVIKHDINNQHMSSYIDLEDNEVFIIRNWGNDR